jgi:hypothetical protein
MRRYCMSPTRNRVTTWVLALAVLACFGCASAGLVNMWAMPGFDMPMKSMLVIAMKPNETHRRIMEDAFVGELRKYDVTATASYTAFAGALPDTQAVREYVRANALDGVLVAVRLPTQESTLVNPGYTTTESRTRYNAWTGRYDQYYTEFKHEPTTETQRIVPHRVEVWQADGKGGRIVWTAEGRSIDPSSANQVSKDMCGAVLPELVKADVIPAKRK